MSDEHDDRVAKLEQELREARAEIAEIRSTVQHLCHVVSYLRQKRQ